MSLTSVDLPEPDTPVTATRQPSGNDDVDVAAGCARGRPATVTTLAGAGAAAGRAPGWSACPTRYWPVIDSLLASRPPRPGDRAGVDDGAAVLARPGPDVDHVVGGADGLLVVLDHDHRVAQVAQPHQRADQPLVVALVQADRRLVEHVEHADQPAADLAGQADPLRLAARQRAGRAGRARGSRGPRRAGTACARGPP